MTLLYCRLIDSIDSPLSICMIENIQRKDGNADFKLKTSNLSIQQRRIGYRMSSKNRKNSWNLQQKDHISDDLKIYDSSKIFENPIIQWSQKKSWNRQMAKGILKLYDSLLLKDIREPNEYPVKTPIWQNTVLSHNFKKLKKDYIQITN